MSKPIEIATFQKNRRETLRVTLDTYQGTNLIDLRVCVVYRRAKGALTQF